MGIAERLSIFSYGVILAIAAASFFGGYKFIDSRINKTYPQFNYEGQINRKYVSFRESGKKFFDKKHPVNILNISNPDSTYISFKDVFGNDLIVDSLIVEKDNKKENLSVLESEYARNVIQRKFEEYLKEIKFRKDENIQENRNRLEKLL